MQNLVSYQMNTSISSILKPGICS